MMRTQTAALFYDAYRQFNAQKLFWITLILSGLVAAVVALLGIGPEGISIAAWTLPQTPTTETLSRETFYKQLFVSLGISLWLSWIAAILALISTAGLFPRLINSCAIYLLLSRPIGRVRLFLTQYVAGLIFVALQVAIFTVACFLIIGFRGGAWEPGLFLAIPLVVVFFSYLFSVCVLLGLITRSTIAALILTLLIWFGLYMVNTADMVILNFRATAAQRVEHLQTAQQANGAARFPQLDERLEEAKASQARWTWISDIVWWVKTPLPKTDGTIHLLERWLIDLAELPEPASDTGPRAAAGSAGPGAPGSLDRRGMNAPNETAVARQHQEYTRDRSAYWILGTSLAFEGLLLALGAWVFSRRNF